MTSEINADVNALSLLKKKKLNMYIFSKNEVINDGGVKKMVNEQMTQWSEMVERHRREKWALQKQQATEQQDALVKLMETLQAAQMKQLEVRHEKYIYY